MMAFSETFEQAIADTSNFKTSAPVTIDLMCILPANVFRIRVLFGFHSGSLCRTGQF
jgi:hypothetical protein